ncbi:YveK family protein [Ornithinibacillus bavariensis]|uniref:YveK family protein n=1 Tax=Ornithinibacillus bavariensis TaxID=545502 RepID=UPI003D21D18B
MKDTLTIQDIAQLLKKRIVLIAALTIGFIVIAAIISFYLLTPTYKSSSQFIVNQQQSDSIPFSVNEIQTNLELINTYTEIMKSPFILEKVITELNLSLTPTELGKKIEVISNENSQVVSVSALADTPEEAAELANVIVTQFKNTIPSIMNIENVFVLSEANPVLSQDPVFPRPFINMIIAGIIGAATSVGLVFLLEFLNTKVKLESDIEVLGITVLGVISKMARTTQRNREAHNDFAKEERSLEA